MQHHIYAFDSFSLKAFSPHNRIRFYLLATQIMMLSPGCDKKEAVACRPGFAGFLNFSW